MPDMTSPNGLSRIAQNVPLRHDVPPRNNARKAGQPEARRRAGL